MRIFFTTLDNFGVILQYIPLIMCPVFCVELILKHAEHQEQLNDFVSLETLCTEQLIKLSESWKQSET